MDFCKTLEETDLTAGVSQGNKLEMRNTLKVQHGVQTHAERGGGGERRGLINTEPCSPMLLLLLLFFIHQMLTYIVAQFVESFENETVKPAGLEIPTRVSPPVSLCTHVP